MIKIFILAVYIILSQISSSIRQAMAGDTDVCPKPQCKKKVKKGDNAIRCDGFCAKWYHIQCVDISETNYKTIQDAAELMLWLCYDCKRVLKQLKIVINPSASVVNIDTLSDKIDLIGNKITSISNQVDEHTTRTEKIQNENAQKMEEQITSLSDTYSKKQQTYSYSDAVKNYTNTTDKPKNKNVLATIIVKQKKTSRESNYKRMCKK